VISFEFEMGERVIVVGCYGSGTDWLCRLTDVTANQKPYSEAYKTQPDLGYIWMRLSPKQDLWLASCMVQKSVFPEADALRKLMEKIMHRAIRDDWQLNWVIEFVQTDWKATFDGEEGYLEWGRR
jgi:hypothetical protein